MNAFKEYDLVRIVRLLNPDRTNYTYSPIARPARIGDIGTIVLIHPEINPQVGPFVVECCDEDGVAFYVEDFYEEELELIERDGE